MKEYFRNIVVFLLTLEAKAIVRKYRPRIIAVTGSVGKTSAKDAVYGALKGHAFVRKSEKSFNSDIGVPLTILGVPNGWGSPLRWLQNLIDGLLLILLITPYPRWLIVEVGADRPGDISRSLAWLTPSIVVGTLFPNIPVHVEFYDSPEAVFKEEAFPFSRLPQDGAAVLNIDDEHAASLPIPQGVRAIRYGFARDADVRATHYRVSTVRGVPHGISFFLHYGEERVQISLEGVIGKVHAYAVLAGVAGALAAGAPFPDAGRAVAGYRSAPGRLRMIAGANGSTIIDDSYNASPTAVEEALRALGGLSRAGRRFAVLADMLELGTYSAREHKRIGELAADSADVLVTVGVRARHIADGALEAGIPAHEVRSFDKTEDASAFLYGALGEGDTVLVKGSQSMRMERVVKALMKAPDDAHKLLARQEVEWLARP